MENSELGKKLKNLVQLDIDAIHAYEQAIEKTDVPTVKTRLAEFKNDHQKHVNNLSPFVQQFGEQIPTFSPDLKGYLLQGFTALRSVTGTEGALKAMKTNEMLTNKKYSEALSWELPNHIRNIVESNRDDEKRHLEFIEQCIKDEVWVKKERAA